MGGERGSGFVGDGAFEDDQDLGMQRSVFALGETDQLAVNRWRKAHEKAQKLLGHTAADCRPQVVGEQLGAFEAVAPPVRDLQVVELICAAQHPRNDVIDLDPLQVQRLITQRTYTASLLPKQGDERRAIPDENLHGLDLAGAVELEDVDELAVERAVLALSEGRQPIVQLRVETNHETDERGHDLSIHRHGVSPATLCHHECTTRALP